jgi:hypothetical protein
MRCFAEVYGNIWCGSDGGIIVFNPNKKEFIKTVNFGIDSKYKKRIISFAKDQNKII